MARKKASKSKPLVEKIEHEYHAFIKVFGKPYEASGATVKEAIANLDIKKAAGVTVLILKHGDKTQEKILPKLATVRLFAPSVMVRERALTIQASRFDL